MQRLVTFAGSASVSTVSASLLGLVFFLLLIKAQKQTIVPCKNGRFIFIEVKLSYYPLRILKVGTPSYLEQVNNIFSCCIVAVESMVRPELLKQSLGVRVGESFGMRWIENASCSEELNNLIAVTIFIVDALSKVRDARPNA